MRSEFPGRAAAALLLLAATAAAPVQPPAQALRELHQASAERLRDSPFGRAMFIDSAETGDRLSGDVYAEVDHAFADVAAAFDQPAGWCEALILIPNIARCSVVADQAPARVTVRIARRFDQPADEAHPVSFEVAIEKAGADWFEARLDARKGPMGTSNYRIRLEAIPLDAKRSFLHLAYSYSYGWSARMATQAYLSTKGADKVGFTVVGSPAGGKPQLIGGLRGAVERNAMRYYLALDAYLDASAGPDGQRFERSLELWLDAIERYPRQLAEESREAYVAAKRARQREAAPPPLAAGR